MACGLGVAGRPVSVGSGRDPAPRPAPAQSPPRPNPIVPPGLGLASPLARTKLDAGRVTFAVPGTKRPRARPTRPAPALGRGASSLGTRPPRRGRHGSQRTPVELSPPAAARWYAPQREATM